MLMFSLWIYCLWMEVESDDLVGEARNRKSAGCYCEKLPQDL